MASEGSAPETLAQVIWQDGRYDIQHYLRVEDAEALLARIDENAELATTEGLTLLTAYIEANFAASVDGEAVDIESISAEVDDEFVYLYQTATLTTSSSNPKALTVSSHMLQDLDPAAQTLVEITTPKGTEAYTLMAGEQSRISGPTLTTL